MTKDKALRPDTFIAPSRAGGVRVESEARLDAAEHDGREKSTPQRRSGLLRPRDRPARAEALVPRTVRRVDDVSTFAHYAGVMRPFWLSLLMVIALASGGVANAMVMADCPMLAQASAQPEMGAGHDCCPDDAPAAPDEQPAKKMGDCAMAQACRAAPALTPSVEPVSFIVSVIVVREPVMSDKSMVSRAPDEFWRPPRTI